MQTETRAIVLRVLKYGERKLIVDLLTREGSRVSCVATLSAGKSGGMKKSVLGLLNIVDAAIDVRPNRQLQKLQSARIGIPYADIPFDARKMSIALFLAEFLYHSTRDEQHNTALYDFVQNSLLWLDASNVSFANFHLVFMMHVSRFVGFYPNANDYHAGDVFDLRAAAFAATPPQHSDYLSAADAARVNTLLRMQYATMHLFRMSHEERNHIAEIILQYYRLHVPSFPELRSFDVLKTLWETER